MQFDVLLTNTIGECKARSVTMLSGQTESWDRLLITSFQDALQTKRSSLAKRTMDVQINTMYKCPLQPNRFRNISMAYSKGHAHRIPCRVNRPAEKASSARLAAFLISFLASREIDSSHSWGPARYTTHHAARLLILPIFHPSLIPARRYCQWPVFV